MQKCGGVSFEAGLQNSQSPVEIVALELIFLCTFAFIAGLVDAVVGGGGLVQLPALLLFLPAPLAASIPAVFGTNKLASVCGTGMALLQYARRVRMNWSVLRPAGGAALVFAFVGADAVTRLNPALLKPLIFALLVAVAIYTYRRKDFGDFHRPRLRPGHEKFWGIIVGAGIGFYDGFFGPGTGSFLIFIFIGWFGFDFLHASASAKLINFATNIAAVCYFVATDNVYYTYALPMALCNVAGSLVGTKLAIWKGNRFIRGFFLVIVMSLIAKFGYEFLRHR